MSYFNDKIMYRYYTDLSRDYFILSYEDQVLLAEGKISKLKDKGYSLQDIIRLYSALHR